MYIVNLVIHGGMMYVWRQERVVFYCVPFLNNWSKVFFAAEVFLYMWKKAVAVCILADGSAHYHVQYKSEIGLVRTEQREMLFYEMDAISLKVLRVWSNLGYVI